MTQRPTLPPFYRVEEIDADDFSIYLYVGTDPVPGELAELVTVNGKNSWPKRETAEGAAWADFNGRENAGEWPQYIGELRGEFVGFLGLTDEQREVAGEVAARYAPVFVEAGQAAPTVDTVVLGSHLKQFVGHASAEMGGKSSKLVSAIFDGKTQLSEATSLMLAALVIRMYGAPYESLNEAGLDFANGLVAVLDIVSQAQAKPTAKHGGRAKGKRPQ